MDPGSRAGVTIHWSCRTVVGRAAFRFRGDESYWETARRLSWQLCEGLGTDQTPPVCQLWMSITGVCPVLTRKEQSISTFPRLRPKIARNGSLPLFGKISGLVSLFQTVTENFPYSETPRMTFGAAHSPRSNSAKAPAPSASGRCSIQPRLPSAPLCSLCSVARKSTGV